MSALNQICITGIAATIDALLDQPCHAEAAEPIPEVLAACRQSLGQPRCRRVVMYNPDAVAQWIYEKYREAFYPLEKRASLKLPMLSVVPPVTPVCFASMYSGMQPSEHGIQKYEKPVLTVPTVFDDSAAAACRTAIVSTSGDSISMIFQDREIDYYIYPTKQECNRKALELIEEDDHNLIVLYNGDYDHYMHRVSPTGRRAIAALQENIATWCALYRQIQKSEAARHQMNRDLQDEASGTALAFAPDHGCHEVTPFFGSHGIEQASDMNICHFWSFL